MLALSRHPYRRHRHDCSVVAIVQYLDRPRIGRLHQHKRHRRAEEDDMRVLEVDQVFALQVSVTSD